MQQDLTKIRIFTLLRIVSHSSSSFERVTASTLM